jgi:ribose transport system substrate-binding protein
MDIGENLDWIGHAIIDAEMRRVCGLPLISDPKIPAIFSPRKTRRTRGRRPSFLRVMATPM